MRKQLPSSGVDSARGVFRDLDELNHAVSGADLELMQLHPGELEVLAQSYDIGELSVDRGSINCGLRVKGSLDARRCAVGVFHPGARAMLNGISVDASTVLFYTPGLELDGHLQEGYGWTSLVMPSDWVESVSLAARHSSILSTKAGCTNMRPDASKLTDLWVATDAIIAARSQLEQSQEGVLFLCSDIRNALGALLSEFDIPSGKAVTRSLSHYRTARRAESYMRDRVSEDLCIDDICTALRVSRRYLEYAFVDAFGTSPSRYLRVLRLHQVRRQLRNRNATTTVTREALNHGFTHLSLFSQQYRALFGESPSSTLTDQS